MNTVNCTFMQQQMSFQINICCCKIPENQLQRVVRASSAEIPPKNGGKVAQKNLREVGRAFVAGIKYAGEQGHQAQLFWHNCQEKRWHFSPRTRNKGKVLLTLERLIQRHTVSKLTKNRGEKGTKNPHLFTRAISSQASYACPNARNRITANGPRRIDSSIAKGYEHM
jgi:hypothetical protein